MSEEFLSTRKDRRARNKGDQDNNRNADNFEEDKYGSSQPLAYLTIGFITMLYGLYLTDAISNEGEIITYLNFGVVILFISGIFECLRKHTFNYTMFFLYGTFFYICSNSISLSSKDDDKRNNNGFGTIVFFWVIIDIIFFILSFKKGVVFIIFYALHAVFAIVLAAAAWSSFHEQTLLAAGVLGCITSIVSIYASLGLIFNPAFGIVIIPLGLFQGAEENY